MSEVLLLGPAHEAAGVRRAQIDGETLAEVMAAAVTRFGPRFGDILAISRLWVNGESATPDQVVGPSDEIAVVPPVSGG